MRKALASLAGLLGLAALVRSLRRHPAVVEAPAPGPAADPADELRRRLDQSRAEQNAAEPVAAAQQPEPRSVSLEERRARVHAQAQEALELMREPGSGS